MTQIKRRKHLKFSTSVAWMTVSVYDIKCPNRSAKAHKTQHKERRFN